MKEDEHRKRSNGEGEINEKIKHFVEEVKEYLIAIYGERIKQVILYGSFVRGEATEESVVS